MFMEGKGNNQIKIYIFKITNNNVRYHYLEFM